MATNREELSTTNADAFWKGSWATDQTGWKAFEKDKSVFSKNIIAIDEAMAKYQPDAVGTSNANTSHVKVFADLRGAFVPLCGDTYALRFLADGFLGVGIDSALKQIDESANEKEAFAALGDSNDDNLHFVMGVDLAPESIEANMKVNFPEVKFTVIDHSNDAEVVMPLDGSKKKVAFTHYFARVINPTNYNAIVNKKEVGQDHKSTPFADIHLFAGDYFEVTAWWRQQFVASNVATSNHIPYKPFDFAYDRASMIAMHPDLRQAYVDAVISVFGDDNIAQKKVRIFLELVQRPEGSRHVGPPFHIDPLVVAASPSSVAVVDETDQPKEGTNFHYPLPFRRVKLAYEQAMPEGVPFRFTKHLLFVE